MSIEEASSSQAVHNQDINISDSVKILLERANSISNYEDNFSPIYVVPRRLRQVNPSAFTPRVVSIGPIHRGRANLKLMEDNKASYLDELLTMVGSPREVTLTRCHDKVSDRIHQIKKYYFGECFDGKKYPLDANYGGDDDELVRMMVMDACFILQFINKLSISGNLHSDNRLRSRSVAVDLVLLENQIPYFVLKDIYESTFETISGPKHTLIHMLHNLLERVSPFFDKLKAENLPSVITPYHILGLLHKFYQPKSPEPPKIKTIPAAHSAIELHKVGVRFRLNKEKQANSNTPMEIPLNTIESGNVETGEGQKDKMWLMAVEFEQSRHKPTLRMSEVLIDNYFEVVMRNLIAYEHYSTPVKNYVTSYAMAMGMLAATPDDIAKLAEANIIYNNLGSNEKASDMISSICKDLTFPDFYYIDSREKAKRHYDSYWSKNFGVFKRIYFSTPWKAIALLAAVIVFAIAVIQFVLRIITFVRSHGTN